MAIANIKQRLEIVGIARRDVLQRELLSPRATEARPDRVDIARSPFELLEGPTTIASLALEIVLGERAPVR